MVIDGREIPVRGLAEGHAWFDFAALCEGPRAASDYIEIATECHTVLVGGHAAVRRAQRRSGAALRAPGRRALRPPRQPGLHGRRAAPVLYTGKKLAHAFERTASRLIEMQSAEYLALEHRG